MDSLFSAEITLEGYQAIFKPSRFGYSMAGQIDQGVVDQLEADRAELLKWCESRLKNPKRSTIKPEPWEEMSDGQYRVKFSWNEENQPAAFDCDLVELIDPDIELDAGAKVSVRFHQKPYILKDGVTCGTTLKLICFQVLRLAKHDHNYSVDDMRRMFQRSDGYIYKENNN